MALALVMLAACDAPSPTGWQTSGERIQHSEPEGITITIGDIEPDTPTSRHRRLRPLADHLARELGWAPERVKVRIARSLQEISTLMRRGEVDLYVDSSYPVLLVSVSAESEILLESPVNGRRVYDSLIISDRNGEIKTLQDLLGQTIALQERYSTSGYLLPLAMLLYVGYEVEYLAGPSVVSESRIGFLFSGDEENTLSMLRQGKVAAGALSGADWENLPDVVKKQFRIFAQSPSVPRKLLSVRKGFDADLKARVRESFLAITDQQREEMVSSTGWSWEFIPLDEQSHEGISLAEEMIRVAGTVDLR